MEELAFTLAADSAKQFIVFSSGIISVSAVVANKMILNIGNPLPKILLTAWIVLVLCIGFSIWTLFALTGELAAKSEDYVPSINHSNVLNPATLMFFTLVLGVVMTAWAGLGLLKSNAYLTSTTRSDDETDSAKKKDET